MLRLIMGMLICCMAAPAWGAAKVYLKDGGLIEARSAWRTPGRVHVLVNRDTLAEFRNEEIDLGRTFPKKRTSRTTHRRTERRTTSPDTAKGSGAQAPSPGAGFSLPTLPSTMRGIAPPSSETGEEGAIRKHKKEMKERLEE